MLSFFRSQEQTAFHKSQANANDAIVTLALKEAMITSLLENVYFKPKVVLGFVSPSLDFNSISSKLKNVLPNDTTLILSTTAGELCSLSGTNPLPSLYSGANAGEGDNIVLMLFSSSMVSDVYVASIPLKSEDMATSKKTAAERSAMIAEEVKKVRVPFKMRSDDTLGYTLIDGLSASESFFMEAVYNVAKFSCLLIGAIS